MGTRPGLKCFDAPFSLKTWYYKTYPDPGLNVYFIPKIVYFFEAENTSKDGIGACIYA